MAEIIINYGNEFILNDPSIVAIFYSLIRLFDAKTIVEIGVANGGTTLALCQAAKVTNGKVYAYDIWETHGDHMQFEPMGSPQLVSEMLTDNGMNNFEIFKIDSKSDQMDSILPDNIDFAFIDGDHSYKGVKNDLEKVLPKMSDTCVIAFHDTLSSQGSREDMLEVENQLKPRFQFVNLPNYHAGQDFGVTIAIRNQRQTNLVEYTGVKGTPEELFKNEIARFGKQR